MHHDDVPWLAGQLDHPQIDAVSRRSFVHELPHAIQAARGPQVS
jgi:hypothetical protein